jgi:hypothetical protein
LKNNIWKTKSGLLKKQKKHLRKMKKLNLINLLKKMSGRMCVSKTRSVKLSKALKSKIDPMNGKGSKRRSMRKL